MKSDRDRQILDCLPLVTYVVRRHQRRGLDPEELHAVGQLALVEAWASWDPQHGSWASHAFRAVQRAVFDAVGSTYAIRRQEGNPMPEEVPERSPLGSLPVPLSERIREQIDYLAPQQRTAISLVYADGLPKHLAAKAMGVSYSTFRRIEAEAFRNLQDLVAETTP